MNDSDLVREEVKLPTSCRDKSPVGEEKRGKVGSCEGGRTLYYLGEMRERLGGCSVSGERVGMREVQGEVKL